MKPPTIKVLIAAAALLLFGLLTRGQLVPTNPPPWLSLAWDAPAIPPSSISNYKVYWGGSSGVYSNTVATTNLTVSITNFARGSTYFFAATTVGTNGLESVFSNEISWTFSNPPPAVLNLRITGGK